MKLTPVCIACAFGSLLQLIKRGIIPATKQDETIRAVLNVLATVDYNKNPAQLGKILHRLIREKIENPDPYKELKLQYNILMLGKYEELKQIVMTSPDPFNTALRLAIAGNIIDFGPAHEFAMMETIQNVLTATLGIDHSEQLRKAILNARSILYIGDNAGEIVLDRLFLETIQKENVFFGVRGSAIINDVTEEDAKFVGLDKLATVISNGDSMPGTFLEDTAPAFQELFSEVDLIISKGQGNFEGLYQINRPIFFLLTAKCEVVANVLGVSKGAFIIQKRF